MAIGIENQFAPGKRRYQDKQAQDVAHDAYLRMYVKVSAQSAAYLPCPP